MTIHGTATLAASAGQVPEPAGAGNLGGLVVLAFAVAVIGCCLVFAVEDGTGHPDQPAGDLQPTPVPQAPAPMRTGQRVTHLRLVPEPAARTGTEDGHGSRRPRTRNAASGTVNVIRGADVGT